MRLRIVAFFDRVAREFGFTGAETALALSLKLKATRGQPEESCIQSKEEALFLLEEARDRLRSGRRGDSPPLRKAGSSSRGLIVPIRNVDDGR